MVMLIPYSRGHMCLCYFKFPPVNAGGIPRPDVNMPSPVENVAQGQLQDLRRVDMGYYDVPNDHPPPHDYAINNYAGVPLDVPPAPPAVVCTDFTFLPTHI